MISVKGMEVGQVASLAREVAASNALVKQAIAPKYSFQEDDRAVSMHRSEHVKACQTD